MRLNSDEAFIYIQDPLGLAVKQQVGIDLTIDKIKQIRFNKPNGIFIEGTVIEEQWTYKEILPCELENKKGKFWQLPKGEYSLTFDQGIKLPNNISAQICERSSLNRLGNIIKSSIYDPGFEVDKMGATLYIKIPIIIEQHSRISQIVMEYNTPTSNSYNGQYQGKKDKK